MSIPMSRLSFLLVIVAAPSYGHPRSIAQFFALAPMLSPSTAAHPACGPGLAESANAIEQGHAALDSPMQLA